MNLIEAVYYHGLEVYDIFVQRVDRKIWQELESRSFYHRGMGGLCGPDHEAQNCLIAWFKEFEQKQTNSDGHKETT